MSRGRKQKGLGVGPNDLIARAVLMVSACTVCQRLFHHKPHLHHTVLNTQPERCPGFTTQVNGSAAASGFDLAPGSHAGGGGSVDFQPEGGKM